MSEKSVEQLLVEVLDTVQKLNEDYNERKQTRVYDETKQKRASSHTYYRPVKAKVYFDNRDMDIRTVDLGNGEVYKMVRANNYKTTEEKLNDACKRIEQLEKDLFKTREETADLVKSTFHRIIAEEKRKAIERISEDMGRRDKDLR